MDLSNSQSGLTFRQQHSALNEANCLNALPQKIRKQHKTKIAKSFICYFSKNRQKAKKWTSILPRPPNTKCGQESHALRTGIIFHIPSVNVPEATQYQFSILPRMWMYSRFSLNKDKKNHDNHLLLVEVLAAFPKRFRKHARTDRCSFSQPSCHPSPPPAPAPTSAAPTPRLLPGDCLLRLGLESLILRRVEVAVFGHILNDVAPLANRLPRGSEEGENTKRWSGV